MVSFPKIDPATASAVKYYQDKQKALELRENIACVRDGFLGVCDEVDGLMLSVAMHVSNAILDNKNHIEQKFGEESMENLQATLQSRAMQYYAAMLGEAFLKKHDL